MRRALLIAALAVSLAAGCDDTSHGAIGNDIRILVRRNDQLVPLAIERLAGYKRAAIPQIETALHGAAQSGRLHLITALARIGDGAAVPILRHTALYDITSDVRDAAEAVLTRWAAGHDARATRARAALTEIARKRAAGDGPLLYGPGGLPGVPSTVGAPDPIGADPTP